MRAEVTRQEVEAGAPIASPSPTNTSRRPPSAMPLPIALLLTDLLVGACHGEQGCIEEQYEALRPLLCRLLQVYALPRAIESRIAAFDPRTFDAAATAKTLVAATGAGDSALLETICEIREESVGLPVDEHAYSLGLDVCLQIARAEHQAAALKSTLQGRLTIVKRVEDVVLGCIALALLALPMLVIAAVIRWTSPGPALFVQRRYGEHGREFGMYKFRSMTTMDDGARVVQAVKGDPRVTRFGAFLRRTSLDELPQLFNVLRGEMSLVGPRPHAVAHNEMYRRTIVRYMQRHRVRPGITGFAQVNGWRGETDTLEKMVRRVEHDLAYIERWSLWLDFEIMFLTVFGKKVRTNAY